MDLLFGQTPVIMKLGFFIWIALCRSLLNSSSGTCVMVSDSVVHHWSCQNQWSISLRITVFRNEIFIEIIRVRKIKISVLVGCVK